METRPRSPKPTWATAPRKSLCYKAEPVGLPCGRLRRSSVGSRKPGSPLPRKLAQGARLEPTHPHGRRFWRPNRGVPLSASKAVYGPLTRIFRGLLSG